MTMAWVYRRMVHTFAGGALLGLVLALVGLWWIESCYYLTCGEWPW